MTDKKIKTAKNKVPLSLVPSHALVGAARVFAYGARKYGPGNYLNATPDGETCERYRSAWLRHDSDLQLPNGLVTPDSLRELDPESGLPHIDHMIAGLIMLRTILGIGDPGVGNTPPVDTSSEPGYSTYDQDWFRTAK
jgi:hypothetical protein